MPDTSLGGGLMFDDAVRLEWVPGPLPEDAALARLNAENMQLLAADSTLGEVRLHETLKDESPALVHELQRLDYKLNILLRLVADLATRQHALPPPRPVKFSSSGLQWFGDGAPARGSTGVLMLYVNPSLPQPLKIPAVAAVAAPGASASTWLQFTGLSESVVELIEKLIFRHHRRLVAGSRLAPNRNP